MRTSFAIACFRFALHPPGAELEEAWRAFGVAAGSGEVELTLELTAPVSRPPSWQPLLPTVLHRPDGSLRLEGDGFVAEISADRRKGWVRQPPERFPTEAVLRVLLAESLLRRGGMLIHGVALAHEGRAAVFTGFSGAGKSTLGHWGTQGGLSLLSDELVAVVPDGEGFTVHGTPWNAGGPGRAALAMIGILTHAAEATLSPIEPSAVLRVLLSNVLEPGPEARGPLFHLASGLLDKVPTRRLAFAKDAQVARVLRDVLAPR